MSEVIEPVVARVLVVGHLPERDHLVSELLQVRGQFLQLGARLRMVRLSAVARWHQAGEQRGAARGAARRGDEGTVECQAGSGNALHVRRPYVLRSVHG
jgi:hypothetical protein